jgi:hypothetical protein
MVWPIDPNRPTPDPEYAASVRAQVAAEIGAPLACISDAAQFVGRWLHSYRDESTSSRQRDYRNNGTYRSAEDAGGAPDSQWRLDGDLYIERIWIDPMPEYGIPHDCLLER